MYQLEWASEESHAERSKGVVYPSRVDAGEVKRVYLALWEEHCVECAVPECYAVCPLYVARRDRKCARFRGGIFPNPEYSGMYPFGADISFRRWGKLEAKLDGRIVSLNAAQRRQATDRNVIALLNPVSTALSILSPSRRLNGAYHEPCKLTFWPRTAMASCARSWTKWDFYPAGARARSNIWNCRAGPSSGRTLWKCASANCSPSLKRFGAA